MSGDLDFFFNAPETWERREVQIAAGDLDVGTAVLDGDRVGCVVAVDRFPDGWVKWRAMTIYGEYLYGSSEASALVRSEVVGP